MNFLEFCESITLRYHDVLNPKLWNNTTKKLKPEVRETLLRFADAWLDFAKIPRDLVLDVYFTGGNANYNYTSQSDIDVHVVVDKRLFGVDRGFLDEYMKTKKSLWAATHHVHVYGFGLEPYTQDVSDSFPAGQGVYSLQRDEWVLPPVQGHYDFESDKALEKRVDELAHRIDELINHGAGRSRLKQMKDKLNALRTAGLERAGEFSRENLIFKELRNRGYLDKLKQAIKDYDDNTLSLD